MPVLAYPSEDGMLGEPGLICSSMLLAGNCLPAVTSQKLLVQMLCKKTDSTLIKGLLLLLLLLLLLFLHIMQKPGLASEGNSATSLSHMNRALLMRYSDRLSFTQAIIWRSIAASPISESISRECCSSGLTQYRLSSKCQMCIYKSRPQIV